MTRGLVVKLTPEQIVARALYLAGKKPLSALDEHVRKSRLELATMRYALDADEIWCPDLFYRLEDHNGGKDPTAPDPADRWYGDSQIQFRTVDCSGGNAWMHGFDRFQPQFPYYRDRIGHLEGGWINTDSKIIDATSDGECFVDIGRPEPGCIITCKSGSYGHRVGHEGTVVAVHCLEWDPSIKTCWELVDVVDCADRQGRTNKITTARGWFGTGAMFLRSVMEP